MYLPYAELDDDVATLSGAWRSGAIGSNLKDRHHQRTAALPVTRLTIRSSGEPLTPLNGQIFLRRFCLLLLAVIGCTSVFFRSVPAGQVTRPAQIVCDPPPPANVVVLNDRYITLTRPEL